jgi:hypothetical protein
MIMNLKKTIRRFLFVLLTGVCLSCTMFTTPEVDTSEKITAIKFRKDRLELQVNGSEYLQFSVTPSGIQNTSKFEWEYDESIISISPDNYGVVITGVSEGNAYIKCSSNGITATALVFVSGVDGEFIGEPYIYSNTQVIELTPGSTQTVSVSLYGGQSVDLEDFTWSIGNAAIADISPGRNNCVVRANYTGTTQIKASHPKAAYPYTFIVYSYNDNLAEPYLTTDSNVVTINKQDTSSRLISVSLQNSFTTPNQGQYRWELIDGSSVVSLNPNGETAVVNALSNGIALVRVTNIQCAWPLDILVRVTTAVQNVYIVPSTGTLEVIGSSTAYNVFAEISGYNGYANPDAFTWTIPDTAASFMDWQAAGNTLSVTGKLNGSVKVRVSHELCDYARSILIILREQDGSAIDASMYITTSTNYLQTKAGADTSSVSVSLVGGRPGDEQNLLWQIENGVNNDICTIVTPTGSVQARTAGSYAYGQLYITPLKPGTARVFISHPKILYETEIVIKVYSENALLVEPVYLNSSMNIVRMLNGTTQEVTVSLSGNAAAGDENGVSWESDNASLVSLSPASGSTVILSALGTGSHQTYVIAKHPKALSDKRILVLSADTAEALDAMKGIYSDQTYFRINVNASATFTLNQFGLSSSDINSINWTVDKPNVATIQKTTGNYLEATATGVTAGNAVITASLAGAEPCTFHLAVLPEGEDVGLIQPKYLTTQKNAVVLSEPGKTANISVIGVNISPADMATKTLWYAEDPAVVQVSASGEEAVLTALSLGKTKVHVSNMESDNDIVIDVKVGALYEWEDGLVVYITTEQDVVTMVKGEQKTIGAALVNSTSTTGFSWQLTGTPIISMAGSGSGVCLIEANEAGVSEITVSNALAVTSKEILVVIANTSEELNGYKYLSTKQNVVTVGETFNTTVTVTVQNSQTNVLSGYNWVSSDPSVVQVVASGQVAVFYGKKMGTAKITVTNDLCDFPLEIIANCVDPVMAANNPYIMSPNIISLTVGDSATTITAELVGGRPSDNVNFNWQMLDGTIASCYSSNETAQIRALKEGVTQLVIRHPKANDIERTVLVICEPKKSEDCYITTAESIIRMSPSDGQKTITAQLSGGTQADAYNFKWWADNYDIINFNYAGGVATVSPLASGSTTIHISHPKATYQKDIILYISQYAEFKFDAASKSVPAGTQTFVNMQVPASNVQTKVSYTSNNATVVSASGTNAVCVINAHQEGSAVVTASLVAVSSGAVQATAELLVYVTPSATPATYINYAGSTIITIEKGITRSLSAALAGLGAVSSDSNSLQWWASDKGIPDYQRVLRISPTPSNSGVTVNKEIQITALQAGKECTITIHHEKSNSDVILYCIVPGENMATVRLDRSEINMIEGDSPASITATITNAQENDYANLQWSVQQDDDIIAISGTGKKISVLPKKPGTALITAVVPSSQMSAACTIKVEEPKTIRFDYTTVSTYPFEIKTLHYTVTPESETDSVTWTIGDNAYVAIASDDKNGTLTFMGKPSEGTTTITGTTKSKAKATLTVNNGWGNAFSVEKSQIRSVPVNKNDGTFDVKYEVRPSNARIFVMVPEPDKLILKSGTYDSFDAATGTYRIDASRHEQVNTETGAASGTLRFEPLGETRSAVVITAHNPALVQNADGTYLYPYDIASKTVEMQIYYNSYTFTPYEVARIASPAPVGIYSRYDTGTGNFVLGDGETLRFKLKTEEQNGTPQIIQIGFTANTSSSDNKDRDPDKKSQHELISTSTAVSSLHTLFTVTHDRDYGPLIDKYYDLANINDKVVEQYNRSVRDVILAGTIDVSYRQFSNNAVMKFSFPLYVEVRNCARNY